MIVEMQREKAADILEELKPLLEKHWQEIALYKDKIKLDPDYDGYLKMEIQGKLHIITVRVSGKLMGYHIAFLSTHPHYKQDLIAASDIYFLDPEIRKVGIGTAMFVEVERSLRALGVKKIVEMTKLHQDHGKLLVALGFEPVETVYSKYIGS